MTNFVEVSHRISQLVESIDAIETRLEKLEQQNDERIAALERAVSTYKTLHENAANQSGLQMFKRMEMEKERDEALNRIAALDFGDPYIGPAK